MMYISYFICAGLLPNLTRKEAGANYVMTRNLYFCVFALLCSHSLWQNVSREIYDLKVVFKATMKDNFTPITIKKTESINVLLMRTCNSIVDMKDSTAVPQKIKHRTTR